VPVPYVEGAEQSLNVMPGKPWSRKPWSMAVLCGVPFRILPSSSSSVSQWFSMTSQIVESL
jgi:hypothetical protein